MADGDALKKVQRGQPLRIPASAYNAFVDVARAHRQHQQDQRGGDRPSVSANGIVLVRNESGGDIGRFGVLELDGSIIDPDANLEQFTNRIALKGVTPGSGNGGFGILLEPLKANAIGRACVSGVCVARVQTEHEDHRFAGVDNGSTAHLISDAEGPAQILWHQAGTGVKWAIVRLSNDAGAMIPVTVAKTGGVAGDWNQTCTFTYEVRDLAGHVLLTSASPLRPRLPNTEYVTPSPGSYGVAFRDASGNWRLYEAVQERPATKTLNVITDYGVDTTDLTLWKKQRPIRVLEMDEESDPITVHTGTNCI